LYKRRCSGVHRAIFYHAFAQMFMQYNDISVDSFESLDSSGNVYASTFQQNSTNFTGGNYNFLHNAGNILRDVMTDEQFAYLRRLGLLNEKALRDFHIRKTFKEFRTQHISAHHAIEKLQTMYPYLQFDTLRKIVYQINDKEKHS
jgi:hypothetical protein